MAMSAMPGPYLPSHTGIGKRASGSGTSLFHDIRARFLTITAIPPGFAVFLIAVGATLLLFWRLGEGSLEAFSDEGLYARIAREMAWGGDWLTPQWNYEVWFDKPPLTIWLTAAFFQLFGVSEFWARAASAAFGAGAIVITYLIASDLYGRAVGVMSAAVLATAWLFIWSARVGMMDVPLTFFTTLAVYGYVHFDSSDYRRWYLIWLACAAAIMTKSAAALVIPAFITLAMIMDRQVLSTIRSLHFWIAAGIAGLLVTPWHILMLLKYGEDFFYRYVTVEVLDRATTTGGLSHSRWLVLETLRDHFHPWFFVVLPALLLAAAEIARGQSRARVLLFEIVVVSALYTSAANALRWYLLPMYPALAILIAALIVQAIRSPMGFSFWAVCLSAVLAGPTAPKKFIVLIAVCLAITLIGRKWMLRLLAPVCTLFLIAVGWFEAQPLYTRRVEPAAVLAKAAARQDNADQKALLLFSERAWWYRQIVAFYNNRTLQPVSTVADLEALLEDGQTLPILLPKNEIAEVARCCNLDIHDTAADLVYGTVRRSFGTDTAAKPVRVRGS